MVELYLLVHLHVVLVVTRESVERNLNGVGAGRACLRIFYPRLRFLFLEFLQEAHGLGRLTPGWIPLPCLESQFCTRRSERVRLQPMMEVVVCYFLGCVDMLEATMTDRSSPGAFFHSGNHDSGLGYVLRRYNIPVDRGHRHPFFLDGASIVPWDGATLNGHRNALADEVSCNILHLRSENSRSCTRNHNPRHGLCDDVVREKMNDNDRIFLDADVHNPKTLPSALDLGGKLQGNSHMPLISLFSSPNLHLLPATFAFLHQADGQRMPMQSFPLGLHHDLRRGLNCRA